jgi:hypothetical protein
MTENVIPDGGFDVRLHRSGRTVTVPPVRPFWAFCSTTASTKVIEGIPDHRDSFLSDEKKAENSKIMICCSRSKSPVLTLDL